MDAVADVQVEPGMAFVVLVAAYSMKNVDSAAVLAISVVYSRMAGGLARSGTCAGACAGGCGTPG